MAVKIYIWTEEGMLERWGHVSMSLGDGTYISWWPEGHDKKSIKNNPVMCPVVENQTQQQDVKLEGKAADKVVTISGVKLDEAAIKTWYQMFSASDEKWSAFGNNCSAVVYKALKEGGALVYFTAHERYFWESTLVPSTPKHIDNFVSLLNKKQNKKMSTGEDMLHVHDTNKYV